MVTILERIEVISGVSVFDGSGFCTVVAKNSDGTSTRGQLTPDEVREMALAWLVAAEAAVSDAAVAAQLRKIDLPQEVIAGFINELRDTRKGS